MRMQPDQTFAPERVGRKVFSAPRALPSSADPAREAFGAACAPHMLDFAEGLARHDGVSLVQALFALGLVSEDDVVERVAAHLGLRAWRGESLELGENVPWREALRSGVVPVRSADGQAVLLVCCSPAKADRLLRLKALSGADDRLLLASRSAFEGFLVRQCEREWLDDAVCGFAHEEPELAAGGVSSQRWTALALFGLIVAASFGLILPQSGVLASVILCILLLPWALLRLFASAIRLSAVPTMALADNDLPTYGVLVPLYREGAIVGDLLDALCAIDYPRAKLDVLLVLEEEDSDTARALEQAGLPSFVRVLRLPDFGPRTKPRALSAALPFCRGDLITVFDAEDRPDPQQLREAAGAFALGGIRLACLQAPLAIDNARAGLIPALFASEYAGLFSVILPALALYGLPLPLGGTSNHFRRVALEGSGGWDSHNVTEDADLGLRLYRLGWRVGTLSRPTFEDAVTTPYAWLKQRRRWFKGWMQTLGVLFRHPLVLAQQVGGLGLLALIGLTAGTVAAALLHPICLIFMMFQLGFSQSLMTVAAPSALLAIGYGSSLLSSFIGLSRQRCRAGAALFALPLYWLALSLAAWLALYDLWRRPFHWDKTHHPARKSC